MVRLFVTQLTSLRNNRAWKWILRSIQWDVVYPSREGDCPLLLPADDRNVTGGLRPDRGWDLRNRGFVIKINKLLRF